VKVLPGVGSNLQDHFNSYLSYRVNQPITLNDIGNSTTRQILAGIRYVFTRTGPLTGTGIYAGAFVRSDSLRGSVFNASPLVRQDHEVTVGIGVSWVFATSGQLVASED